MSAAKSYDPTLLLAEARQLRQKAMASPPPMRNIYQSLAAESERRAILSLNTPIFKESADYVAIGEQVAAFHTGDDGTCVLTD